MHGMIVELTANPGHRDALAQLLAGASTGMPGCISSIVALDAAADTIWITEIWESPEHHAAAIQLPETQAAMAAGRALIASVRTRARTTPVVGISVAGTPDRA